VRLEVFGAKRHVITAFFDDCDAKVKGIQEFMQKAQQGATWTDYHRMFERFFYIGEVEEG